MPRGPATILILGGTAEGRELAGWLCEAGVNVVSSLAGRTSHPVRPAGALRSGGFGGVDGLARWLRENTPSAVVDASHPFAARMTRHAALACAREGVPLLRLSRPGWGTRPDAAGWCWVDEAAEACEAAAGRDGTVLLTTGRQTVADYRALAPRRVLVRVTEAPELLLPPAWVLLVARGPFELPAELALLRDEGVGVLITKDSGGDHTAAKLDAARTLGVRVVMLRRPALPPGVPTVASVADAVSWVSRLSGPAPRPPR